MEVVTVIAASASKRINDEVRLSVKIDRSSRKAMIYTQVAGFSRYLVLHNT